MRAPAPVLLATTAIILPLTVGLPMGVSAQTVDEAGAQVLEQQVMGLVRNTLDNLPDLDAWRFDGTVDAVPAGRRYDLAIPALILDPSSSVQVTIPAVSAVVTPLANDMLRADWMFRSPVTATNARLREQLTISFQSDENSLDIAPQYGATLNGVVGLSNLDLDITGTSRQAQSDITLERASMRLDSAPLPGRADTYDSDMRFTLTGFDLDLADEVAISIGDIEFTVQSSAQRMDLFYTLNEALRGVDPESTAFAETYLTTVLANKDEPWLAGAQFEFALNSVSFQAEEGAGSFDTLALSLAADGLDQPTAQIGLTLDAQGLQADQIPAQFSQVAPTRVALDLEANAAPLQALLDQIYAAAGSSEPVVMGPKGPRARATGGLQGLQSLNPEALLQTLLTSDATVLINTLYIEAPIGYIAADGRIEPDADAALQAVGTIELDVAGLPEMIAFAQRMGGDAAQGSAFVSLLAAMGRDGVDDDGVAIKEFDLELNSTGQIMLNGNDLSALTGMFR